MGLPSLRLVHLANCNSTNIGNGALIHGVERVLNEDLQPNITFLREPWDDYTFGFKRFDREFVDFVNDKSDGLIVGAAVTLDGRPYHKNAGMRFDLPFELWSRFTKPIVFYGISYRVWPYQRYYNLEKFKRAMDSILNNKRILFSVRNDGTKGWLENILGYKSDNVLTVPDPGLYVPVKDSWHAELAGGKINVLISLNNEDEVYRYGGVLRESAWRLLAPVIHERHLVKGWKYVPGWKHRKQQFLQGLARTLDMLLKDWDLNVILCPHYFDDYTIMQEFIAECSLAVPHRDIISTGLLRVPEADFFYDRYAKADLVLSMRVHSMSPAIGLGTPTVALVSQPRMAEFIKQAGLQKYLIDVFDPDLEIRLYKVVSAVLNNREEVRRDLKASCAAMRKETLAFNDKVSSLFGVNGGISQRTDN